MLSDSRQYEIQLIEAVKAISRALSSGGTSSGSTSASSSAASAGTGTVAALNSLVSRLDSVSTKLTALITKLDEALFVSVVVDEQTVKKSLATLMKEQNETLVAVKNSVLDASVTPSVSVLTELTKIKQALDGTTANGVAQKVATVATNVQTGDANIVTALGATGQLGTMNTTLTSIQGNVNNIRADIGTTGGMREDLEVVKNVLGGQANNTIADRLDGIKSDTTSINGKIT